MFVTSPADLRSALCFAPPAVHRKHEHPRDTGVSPLSLILLMRWGVPRVARDQPSFRNAQKDDDQSCLAPQPTRRPNTASGRISTCAPPSCVAPEKELGTTATEPIESTFRFAALWLTLKGRRCRAEKRSRVLHMATKHNIQTQPIQCTHPPQTRAPAPGANKPRLRR